MSFADLLSETTSRSGEHGDSGRAPKSFGDCVRAFEDQLAAADYEEATRSALAELDEAGR